MGEDRADAEDSCWNAGRSAPGASISQWHPGTVHARGRADGRSGARGSAVERDRSRLDGEYVGVSAASNEPSSVFEGEDGGEDEALLAL